MIIQTDRVIASTVIPSSTVMDPQFDLDVSIIESVPVVAELMQITSDNCGQSCETACNSC